MEVKRVFEGSVATRGLEKHRYEAYIWRFCSDEEAGGTMRWKVYYRVLLLLEPYNMGIIEMKIQRISYHQNLLMQKSSRCKSSGYRTTRTLCCNENPAKKSHQNLKFMRKSWMITYNAWYCGSMHVTLWLMHLTFKNFELILPSRILWIVKMKERENHSAVPIIITK